MKKKLIISIILAISLLISFTFAQTEKDLLVNEVNGVETLKNTNLFLLEIGDTARLNTRTMTSEIEFDQKNVWGNIVDENGEKLYFKGVLSEHNKYTLKYDGDISNSDNKVFELYLSKNNEDTKDDSKFQGHLNIIEKNSKSEEINAKTYTISNDNSIVIPNLKEEKTINESEDELTLKSSSYYKWVTTISSYGRAISVYYPKGDSKMNNHKFRLHTRTENAMGWLSNNYDNYTAVNAYGRNVTLEHRAATGSVWNNILPTPYSLTYDVPLYINGLSFTIPVEIASVNVYNDAYADLRYSTTGVKDWVDTPTITDGPDNGGGKIFVSEWKSPPSVSGNNKFKYSIQYRVIGEDSGGLRANFYPTFSSSSFQSYPSHE